MDIRVALGDPVGYRGDALVLGVVEPSGGTKRAEGRGRRRPGPALDRAATAADAALGGALRRLIKADELRGKWGEQILLHSLGRLPVDRLLLVGLGKAEDLTLDRLRATAGEAMRSLRRAGARRVGAVVLGDGNVEANSAQIVQALVEGVVLGLYRFTRYKPSRENGTEVERVSILTQDRTRLRALGEAIRRGRTVAEAVNAARDLVNEPGNTLTPTVLAHRARTLARAAGVRCRVLGPAEIARLRMGGLLGVARGSQEPPRFILLEYRGGNRARPHLGLVGKGVTFDSGGISIKPGENMEAMKGDMAGGAAAVAGICAIARLGLPIRVTAVVPATENLPSGSALKPGDILRAMSGKTIEVINTDAEGRLILADALHYIGRRGVTHVADAATLTGACVVALGMYNTGAFANNPGWLDAVLAAGRTVGEKIWPMPMDPEYDDLIKSDVAEIKNTGGRKGGAITAAKFLAHFAGETPWVHLDIAGTADSDKEKGYQPKGATGAMVRTFVQLAVDLLAAR